MATVSRLLYVDSDTTRAESHTEPLATQFDFDVYTVEDMATATTVLETQAIDCVVSEFELTDGDGFELLSYIRSANHSLPVILIVDDVPETVDSNAFKSGMTALFHRAELADSYEPLIDKLDELLAETPDSSAEDNSLAGSPTSDAVSGTTPSQSDAISTATESPPLTAEPKGVIDALPDGIATAALTRSELEPLEKDQLITLVLQLAGTAESAHSAPETSEPTPPTDSTERPTPDGVPEEIATSESSPDTSGGESDYLPQLDLDPGTTVLVQRRSQPSRKYEVQQALLGATEEGGRNILLIRYRPLSEDRLKSIATTAKQITILTISCTQTVPETVSATVETIRVGRITELRRLGILATRIVNDWEPLGREMRVSIDPLDPLFNYKPVESVFRFLHVLLGKLNSQGAVTQVHITPSAVGDQNSNILKSLFDYTLVVDSQEVTLDSDP